MQIETQIINGHHIHLRFQSLNWKEWSQSQAEEHRNEFWEERGWEGGERQHI